MELPSESYRSDPHPDFPSIGDGQIIMKIHAPEITIAISIAIMSTSIGFIAVGNLSTWCGSNDVVRLDLCRWLDWIFVIYIVNVQSGLKRWSGLFTARVKYFW